MENKNLNIILFVLAAVTIFTLLASLVLVELGILARVATFFILFFVITSYLLKKMIVQMYDLLLSPPAIRETINPFQIIAFGKKLWQYPKEGSFKFLENSKYDSSESSHKPETDIHYEVPFALFGKSKSGPKSVYSEEVYFEWVEKWFEAEKNNIKQANFCRIHDLGSPRNFRKYIKLYKERHQSIPN